MGVFGQRLVEARTRRGWKQADLARRTGVPQQSIQAIEATDQRTSKYAHQLATALDVGVSWLLGEGDNAHAGSDARRAPVRGLVAAGLWQEDESQINDETPVPASPSPRYATRPQIAFRVVGNSMDRLVRDGEYVICIDFAESPMHLRDGDVVVAERRRNGTTERTVKRVRLTASVVELWPDSDDPQHQEPLRINDIPEADEAEIVVKGIVIGFYRPA